MILAVPETNVALAPFTSLYTIGPLSPASIANSRSKEPPLGTATSAPFEPYHRVSLTLTVDVEEALNRPPKPIFILKFARASFLTVPVTALKVNVVAVVDYQLVFDDSQTTYWKIALDFHHVKCLREREKY
jgi:hypothetical protein